MKCWHYNNYGDQYRLQYFWDQSSTIMAYVALASKCEEVSGRQLPPPPLDSEGWRPALPSSLSTHVSEQAYAQATQVAGALAASAEDMIKVAKRKEVATIDPGVVADVDLANAIYSGPRRKTYLSCARSQ